MFHKPIAQLTESDLQILIDNQEKESLILEYKREITGSDQEKRELPKDISAMANTDGGYFIVGIEEKDGHAAAIVGTLKNIGRQPVEEWIETVLITNIRPRITLKPKVIILASDPNKVVVVIHIQQSSKRPHMVVTDSKNAYYKRHNYQATYADEHEIRSMFLESKDIEDKMKSFISSRHLADRSDPSFALNSTSSILSDAWGTLRELPKGFAGKPRVVFSACPRYLEERVDIASEELRSWLSSNEKVDLLRLTNIEFLDSNREILSESIRIIGEKYKQNEVIPYRYLEICRNGYVEHGMGQELMWLHEEIGVMFQIAYFTAAFWMFMKFTRAFYEHIGYVDEVIYTVALADIMSVTLWGFGKKNAEEKWRQPNDSFYGSKMPTSKEKNVKIEKSVIVAEMTDDYIEEVVKDVSRRVSNAFGESIAKCFDEKGNFDIDTTRGFRNIH
jgi:hypothetical protein